MKVANTKEEVLNELRVKKILEGDDKDISLRLKEISSSPDEFKKFIMGLETELNYVSICYRYKDKDNIYDLIRDNEKLIANDEELQQAVLNIDDCFKEYDRVDPYYRRKNYFEYVSVQQGNLGLDRNKIRLSELNSHAYDVFNGIINRDYPDVRKDKFYLSTVMLLTRRYPEYFLYNCPEYDGVLGSLLNTVENDFENRKDYRHYCREAKKLLKTMKHEIKDREKGKNKVKKK